MTDQRPEGKPPKPLSDMTEEERRQRIQDRFGVDAADVQWDPDPDEADPSLPPG